MGAGRKLKKDFDPDKFNKIIESIESGESLRKSCELVEVNRRDFYNWIDEDEDRKNQYARATKDRHDKIFEEILQIADDGSNDTYTDDEGRERTDHDVIARSRLRVDSRKWMLGKMNPKKYGDRINVDQNINERKQVADLFPDELKDEEPE